MHRRVQNVVLGLALAALNILAAGHSFAADAPKPDAPPKTIAETVKPMQRFDGFLPLYWNAADGSLYMEIPKSGLELLYFTTLTQGLGSNDVGLDRGQVGRARLVRFEPVGAKVLLVQPNLDFRARSEDPDERLAVEQSFAQSVLFGFPVKAEEGERLLIDVSALQKQDGHGAVEAITKAKQGTFTVDADRSALYLPGTKAFPRNSEIEVTLTLKGEAPGTYIKDVTPTPQAISLRERYSFVALPEPGYMPRPAQAGDGFFELNFADYAAPIGEPLLQHYLVRHRLQKKDPQAAVGEAVQPIVYYIDRGAPQPIRDALMQGARWWNQAFEAAGYRDAFRVELLPEGADPMDIRYNIIQWVHRATRGWSYGAAVVDPRTGEIIKGNVTLGSLRARYDYLIAEGLLSPYEQPGAVPPEMQKLVMARLSQLAAHELGHTLGLAHNYIGSAQGRSSVMDYPQPLVELRADGSLDLSHAYAEGIGEWDKVAIDYGYRDFPPGTDQPAALNKILADARGRGLTFLTDEDARPAGAAHPDVSLWDNGTDSAAELQRMLLIRKAALKRFGENAIRRGLPMATIEEALVPLYLYHRYQVDAAAKALGGARYTLALRGDGQTPQRNVPAAEQRKALAALLETLAPGELVLPQSLLDQIPPRPSTWPSTRELFARDTAPTFDPLAPAAAAASITIGDILQPERDARLVEQHAFDARLPGFDSVIDELVGATFDAPASSGYAAEILRVEQGQVTDQLISLARSAPMPAVRAIAQLKLEQLRQREGKAAAAGDAGEQAQRFMLAGRIRHFQEHPEETPAPTEPVVPPGSPLGDCGDGP
jgi:hypothetical protein